MRHDFRNAMILAQTANLHRKKGERAMKPSEFMPFLPRPKQTIHDMKAICAGIAAAYAAKG